MTVENLEYEVKLANENHDEIVVKCDLWGSNKEPRVELEVPAYSDKAHNVHQPRMYVTLTLEEFDEVVRQVEIFRKMRSEANA